MENGTRRHDNVPDQLSITATLLRNAVFSEWQDKKNGEKKTEKKSGCVRPQDNSRHAM